MEYRRQPRRRSRSSDEDNDDWMMAYSDIFSILFAFMAIVLSVSTVNVAKVDLLQSSLSGALTHRTQLTSMERLEQQVSKTLEVNEFAKQAQVKMTERGLEIELQSGILFETGQATLSPRALEVLGTLSQTVLDLTVTIDDEGHTDAIPIRSARYPSNWELSAARASEVVRAMIAKGLSPERLKAIGLASTRPADPREGEQPGTEEAFARQRRVTLVLAPQISSDGQNKLVAQAATR